MDLSGRSLQEEIDAFALDHPRLVGLYRQIVTHRMWLFLTIICLTSIYDIWFDGFEPMDPVRFFGPAGLRLFSSEWADTFREPGVQIGPILVALFGLGALLNQASELNINVVVSPVTQALVLFGTLKVVGDLRSKSGSEFTPGFQMFTGLSVLMGGIAWETSGSAHPAESLNALLWIVASSLSMRGKSFKAAAAIAVAASLKPWGLLGLPVLLLDPKISRAVWGAIAAMSMSAAAYLPFAIWGNMRMGDIRWRVTPQSPLRLLLPANSAFGWDMRTIQGVVTVLLATALILLIRRSPRGYWLAPLQVSLVRIGLDPLVYHYYLMTPALIIMIGLLSELPDRPSLRRIVIPTVFYLLALPHFYGRGLPLAAFTSASVAGLILFTLRAASKSPSGQSAFA